MCPETLTWETHDDKGTYTNTCTQFGNWVKKVKGYEVKCEQTRTGPPPPQELADTQLTFESTFDTYDTDGDGVLSFEEFQRTQQEEF